MRNSANSAPRAVRVARYFGIIPFLAIFILAVASLVLFGQGISSPKMTAGKSATLDEIINRGRTALDEGRLDEAMYAAKAAISADGQRFEGYALAAFIAKERGDVAGAESFISQALARAPETKKASLEDFKSSLATKSASAEEQLVGEARRKLDVLESIAEDADKAKSAEERRTFLLEYLEKSKEFIKVNPNVTSVWTLRAAIGLELDRPSIAWDAGRRLVALGAADSNYAGVRKVLAMLERKGWLGTERPSRDWSKEPIEQVKIAADDGDASAKLNLEERARGIAREADMQRLLQDAQRREAAEARRIEEKRREDREQMIAERAAAKQAVERARDQKLVDDKVAAAQKFAGTWVQESGYIGDWDNKGYSYNFSGSITFVADNTGGLSASGNLAGSASRGLVSRYHVTWACKVESCQTERWQYPNERNAIQLIGTFQGNASGYYNQGNANQAFLVYKDGKLSLHWPNHRLDELILKRK